MPMSIPGNCARFRVHLLECALSIACAMGAVAFGQPADFALHTEVMELDGQSVHVDVYEPVDPPAGVAIIAHGFMRSRERHGDLGRALADAGIAAVIPDLPYTMNHWGNGDAIEDLALRLEAGALGMAPVRRSRLVLIGTSAGGLSTVLAAAKLPGLAGWIGLDPVDRTGSGTHAAARLRAPSVVLLGKPSVCNLFGSGRSIAHELPQLLRSVDVKGASHCDFEGPTNIFCRRACGGASPEAQARVRDETIRAVTEMLNRSPETPVDGAPALEQAH